jgi:myosin protein heavy chain
VLHEEQSAHVSNALAREQETVNDLVKSKIEIETKISDLEKQLLLEQYQRQEIECSKHKVDIEVTDLKDQSNECRLQIKKLQYQLVKSKVELTEALIKAAGGAGKVQSQKALNEIKS